MKQTAGENEGALSEWVLQIASRELREDKRTRDQSLEQFRGWLAKNEDIVNMRMDDSFLLRFLRAKKFSVPMAEQTLLKYLNIKRTFPAYATQLDILDEAVNDIIDSGYIFLAPKRDKNGRRVVIMNAQGLNKKKFNNSVQAKAHFLTYEYLMEDPQTQVVGITHVANCYGASTSHVTKWNPTEFLRLFTWSEQSLPLRHKEIHLLNIPSAFKWLYDFLKSRVNVKMRNRVSVYTSETELAKRIDPECLPMEWGGKMPTNEMIKLWKQELKQKRDVILQLDEIHLLSDRGIQRRSSNKPNNQTTFAGQIETIQGSFRKLEFD